MKLILPIYLGILMFQTLVCNAQEYKRNNVWTVGGQPVVKFYFDIGVTIDTVYHAGVYLPPFCIISSASATISDTSGGLLFFTNGFVVYDSNGFAMDSGVYVNCPKGKVLANYYGGKSLFDQTSIILPKKGNTYYVFSTGMSDSAANNYLNHIKTEFDVLNYSVVDMDSNAGKGKVVQKNVLLAENQQYYNTALHAVKHANGKDWWLVKADCSNNRYVEYIVREDTILGPYYQQATDSLSNPFCGGWNQIYFNQQGTQMVSGIYGTMYNGGASNNDYKFNRADIYDFNRCDGKLTFKKYYETPYDTSSYPNHDYKRGLCFSPDGLLLYMSNMYTIYQIDLTDTNTYNATFIHGPDTTIANFPWYDMMGLAPDGKIYIGNGNGTRKYMSYIDKPNVKGLGCDFIANGVWQPYTNLRTPPNMPNYGLGADSALLVGCWPVGIPNMVKEEEEIAIYPNPSANYFQIICSTKFRAEVKYLMDNTGRVVWKGKGERVDVSCLKTGLYYLRCRDRVVKVVVVE